MPRSVALVARNIQRIYAPLWTALWKLSGPFPASARLFLKHHTLYSRAQTQRGARRRLIMHTSSTASLHRTACLKSSISSCAYRCSILVVSACIPIKFRVVSCVRPRPQSSLDEAPTRYTALGRALPRLIQAALSRDVRSTISIQHTANWRIGLIRTESRGNLTAFAQESIARQSTTPIQAGQYIPRIDPELTEARLDDLLWTLTIVIFRDFCYVWTAAAAARTSVSGDHPPPS